MSRPIWIEYGGKAWLPDIQKEVRLERRVYPVADYVDDNYGRGFIVDTGSIDAVVDLWDWMGQRRYPSHEFVSSDEQPELCVTCGLEIMDPSADHEETS